MPKNIEHVYAVVAPASIIAYTLAPEKSIGWNHRLHPAEKTFMPTRYTNLPVLRRLTSLGNTANIEIILKANPDIILDHGSISETYESLADRRTGADRGDDQLNQLIEHAAVGDDKTR